MANRHAGNLTSNYKLQVRVGQQVIAPQHFARKIVPLPVQEN